MSQTLMEDAPATSVAPAVAESVTNDRGLGLRWLPPIMLLAAVVLGLFLYSGFRTRSTELWWWMGHDRHAHYMYGLNLALDVKTADVRRLLHDIDGLRVWGPLHPFLVGAVQIVGGPDHRLAVLPSLAGWILAVWCAYLIPRRMLPTGGDAAGVLAAFLVAISPAHRAFATDVMYESLGAGLSLAVIYCYLATVQESTRRHAWFLAAALSALFLHKYNYWLLVVFGLTAGEFARQPGVWWQYARSLCRRDRLPAWTFAELKHPLNWIALALAAAAGVVVATGGGVVSLGSTQISFTEPHNLIHAAYVAFFVRLVLWWRGPGRPWIQGLPTGVREVVLGHGGVIALWFLMPKRLSYFLWFLSPANSDQQRESVPFMHGLPYYLRGFQEDYLTQPWAVYLVGAMVLLALLAWPRLKPGSAALFFFLMIGTYLTCQHPMLKFRFMHSWVAASWVLGAVGLVFAAQYLAGLVAASLRPWGAGVCCVSVMAVFVPAFLEPGRAQEGGLKPSEPSPLRITETYLPALADAKNPTIVSNISARFLWTWTFIDHHRHQNMSAEIKNFKAFKDNPDAARNWLNTTRSDALVLIDIHPKTTYDWVTIEYVPLDAFHEALGGQTTWTRSHRWDMPEGVTITLWKKTASTPGLEPGR